MARLSQAEQDRRRRARSQGDPRRTRALAIGALVAVALVVLVILLARDDAPVTGETRAANIEAFGLDDDPYKGNSSADVVVVAFEAPRCSSCRAFHFTGLQDLDEEYFQTGQAVFYYVQYRISAEDRDIGILQECALQEGGRDGFWAYTDTIYGLEAYPSLARAEQAFHGWAQDADVAQEAAACYDTRATEHRVDADWDLGDRLGVPGTPTFYVFGREGEPVRTSAGGLADVLAGMVA